MKKLAVLLLAVIMSLGLVFAGCNQTNTHYSNGLKNLDGKVESNGGFAVVKGDYVYFINGVASNTDDNTFGTPVTGSLVRMTTSALKDAADGKKIAVQAEMVIPSLFVAGDLTSGIYMTDSSSNVYFASPYTEKDKTGKVENSRLSFVRAALDGSERTVILSVDDNTTPYRYAEKDGVVYLMIKTTVKDERADDENATRAAIVVYNADNGEKVFTSPETVSEYSFGESTDVYYTATAYDEDLKQEEKYNDVYAYEVGSKESKKVCEGKGSVDGGKEGLTGVMFSIIANTSDALYLKVTYADASVTSVSEYRAYVKNGGTSITLNLGTDNATKVFAANSYYASTNCIIYLDTTYGLIAYNYQFTENGVNKFHGDNIVDNSARLFYDKDLVGYTVRFWNNGYVYLTDSNNAYYRVKVIGELINADGTALTEKKEGKVEKVNFLNNSVSWYLPEVIGDCFLSVYTDSPYNSLVYVSDMTANAALSDEEIETVKKSEEESVQANLNTCISLVSSDIRESIENYMKDTFKKEEDK